MDSYSRCKWKPRKVSAKRDFPDAFCDESVNQSPESDHDVSQLLKKHKVCEFIDGSNKHHVGHDESEERILDYDFIPLETNSASSENCSSETHGSDFDIVPRINHSEEEFEKDFTEKKKNYRICSDDEEEFTEKKNYRICSDDEEEFEEEFTEKKNNYRIGGDDEDDDDEADADADDVDSEGEIAKMSPYIELRLHGVGLKEIRCYQITQNELKIRLEVDHDLNKVDKMIDVESYGEESITSESVIERVTNERLKTYEQIRSSGRKYVQAVRCFPPGCGPNAANLSDEDLKKAIEESKTHMLTCNSCVMRG